MFGCSQKKLSPLQVPFRFVKNMKIKEKVHADKNTETVYVLLHHKLNQSFQSSTVNQSYDVSMNVQMSPSHQ